MAMAVVVMLVMAVLVVVPMLFVLGGRAACAAAVGGGCRVFHAMIGNLKVTSRSSPMAENVFLRIGEAARHSGVSTANIRFYEKQGLLPAAQRQDNAYRSYSGADIHRLRFIRMCRAMDMSLHEVRILLDLNWDSPQDCRAATATVADHLGHVRQRLAELQLLEQELSVLHQRCKGDGSARCALISALHRHAEEDSWLQLEKDSAAKRHV